MNKTIVAILAIASIIFDLVACIGDGNPAVYSIFMGLCCVSFCLFLAGLLRVGLAKTDEITEVTAKTEESFSKAA